MPQRTPKMPDDEFTQIRTMSVHDEENRLLEGLKNKIRQKFCVGLLDILVKMPEVERVYFHEIRRVSSPRLENMVLAQGLLQSDRDYFPLPSPVPIVKGVDAKIARGFQRKMQELATSLHTSSIPLSPGDAIFEMFQPWVEVDEDTDRYRVEPPVFTREQLLTMLPELARNPTLKLDQEGWARMEALCLESGTQPAPARASSIRL